MHSSRMRTGHSLTVCCSLLPGGDLPGPGGVCLVWGRPAWWGGLPGPGGVSAPGGDCLPLGGCLLWGGVLLRGGGGIPACTEADPPVNRMTNRC